MKRHRARVWSFESLITSAMAVLCIFAPAGANAEGSPPLAPVAKASCGSGDRTESVQGQITLAERFAPGTAKAFNCNLELVGQFEGEGAETDVEVYEQCAFYTTANGPKTRHPGVVVLDVSVAQRPRALTYLASPAMLSAFESLTIARRRNLLFASEYNAGPSIVEFYDIADCRRPILKGSTLLPDRLTAHNGDFTPDGTIFFGAKFDFDDPALFALDTRDVLHPQVLTSWRPSSAEAGWVTHSIILSPDTTRAYVSIKRMTDDTEKAVNPNGLAVFDIGAIAARREGAGFSRVSTLFWEDSHGAEGMANVRIKERQYLIFSDNLGAIGVESGGSKNVCELGKPGHGFARIIDVTDDKQPKTISRLMLEVSDPTRCADSMHDPTTYGGYGSFACTVDDPSNGKLVACGNFEAGLRVFDIRDPTRPREVAYYKPPARRGHTADSVLAAPVFRAGAREIAFTSSDNGFQLVRFSERFIAANRDLFAQ